jgi:hypothetical protein
MGWIVSPAFDLLFFANLGWLLLPLPGFSNRTDTAIDFWQVYFLTLPHRWVTLFLVALDPDRRQGRGLILTLVPAAVVLLIVGVWWGTAAFTCLAVVDYVWNAWHFGAQNAGVLRIYSRKVGSGPVWLERHGVRFFVMYGVLRTAGWTTGWLEATPASMTWLRTVDLAVLAIPALLIGSTLVGFDRQRLGKTVYLVSLCGLYSGLILSLSYRMADWVIVLATASSLFHAVEYLAVVTHYAWRRREVGSAGLFRVMARNWLFYLASYMVLLGTMGVWLDREGQPGYELWQGLNLWAALVHYAYDGLIWKLRRPATAEAMGIRVSIATGNAA